MPAYFSTTNGPGGESLIAHDAAKSSWDRRNIRGPAITFALARSLELAVAARPELRATRVTFDLHSPVRHGALCTRARVLRDGRRLMLVESELLVGAGVYARARGLFLRSGQEADSPPRILLPDAPLPEPPPPGVSPPRLYWSRGGGGWTTLTEPHRNDQPKAVWITAGSLVAGEPVSPLGLASAAADVGNLVVNWAAVGLGEINADATLSLARLPVGEELGVTTLARAADGEIAVGSALLFDRRGVLGTTTISALRSVGEPLNLA